MMHWFNLPNVLSFYYNCYHWFGLKWHIPKTGILILRKNSLPFSGHSTKCNQIANSPQNGVSYFKNKWFDVFRGCNKMHDFLNIYGCMECWHAICSQKSMKIPLPNLAKMLSFCYHLETHYFMRVIYRHHMWCDILMGSKSLVLFGKNVIILLSLLSITKKTTTSHVGAFF
jgi:hypothetical protein